MQRARGVETRPRWPGFRPPALAIIAVAGFLTSACSPGADYPSLFPAVHDMPPPRADAPLDAVQIQQATEDLISERNHLNGGVQGAGQKDSSQKDYATPPPGKIKAVSQAAGGNSQDTTGSLIPATETK